MGKKIYTSRSRISSVENRIAILRACGATHGADALQDFFDNEPLDTDRMEKLEDDYRQRLDNLEDY